ncbi:MAG: hypothetical protein P1U85_19065 [Verrucomicrobiales bacterium]|jgi:hypothetical protein|nr:hypothetical protein [Verrucomicrobiales bacterium]
MSECDSCDLIPVDASSPKHVLDAAVAELEQRLDVFKKMARSSAAHLAILERVANLQQKVDANTERLNALTDQLYQVKSEGSVILLSVS